MYSGAGGTELSYIIHRRHMDLPGAGGTELRSPNRTRAVHTWIS
jgi:hypothetical protein